MNGNNLNLRTILDRPARTGRVEEFSPGTTEENQEVEEYVAFARGRVGTRPQLNIMFRQCSGEIDSFPYATLTRIHTKNADLGLVIEIGEVRVTIDGHRLAPLLRYIHDHRVAEIVEAGRADVLEAKESDPIVDRITVQTICQ